jgi:hypothetical protein
VREIGIGFRIKKTKRNEGFFPKGSARVKGMASLLL